jgi:hypothetical protein
MENFNFDFEGSEVGIEFKTDYFGAKIFLLKDKFYGLIVRPWLAKMVLESSNKLDDAALKMLDGVFGYSEPVSPVAE